MDAASVVQLRRTNDSRSRVLEISAQLRGALADGDDAGIARLLGDLLRFRGASRAQCVTLQLRALQSLVHQLRSAALNDELTGLQNRRGFLQGAARLLDVAVRERCPHRLIYLQLSLQADPGAALPMIVLRQMGNTLRDLFANYGVYEALGRLGAGEFAALTPRVEYLSRDSILRHLTAVTARPGPPRTRLDVGIAHFDPLRPVGITELLASSARQASQARELLTRTASSAPGPPTRNDASLTVSGRRRDACKD
ncbi:MAG TPA: GGDEF domain-containing protein [Steroidobacteraceae bacterium]|nr:GGDEF domain-containing protein [Steroidobacteraceae bacterium]